MVTPGNDSSHPDHGFDTTQWSVVLRAQGAADDVRLQAIAMLCERYWIPLYAYLRRRVADINQAQDLTQGFFVYLLESNLVDKADADRGRFRSFLLASCNNFLRNEWNRDRSIKRGGHRLHWSLDFESADSKVHLEPSHNLTAERLFERQWALTLLDQAVDQLQDEYAAGGKAEQFEQLKPVLTAGHSSFNYAEIASQLSLSEDAARQAAHRLRKRYRELLRQCVAQTVDDPGEIDDEIRRLFDALG